MKTDTCPGKSRKVLKIITCSTSMASNDAQSQSQHNLVLLIVFIVLLWMKIIKFSINY